MGAGESGVPFYNLKRIFEVSSSSWSDMLLGVYIPSGLANIPLIGFLALLQTIGLPGVLLEALFFFALMFISLTSLFLLSKELFHQKRQLTWFFSSLFYVFNLYSIMNIWNRFLLNFMLFYAIFPLLLWFFVRSLKSKSYTDLVLMGIFSVIFSYALSSPVMIIILWSMILFISLFYSIFVQRSFFPIKVFISSLFIWMAFNFWWMLQQIYLPLSESSKELFFSPESNIGVLKSISKTLGQLSNAFLLKHGEFYTRPFDYPYNWPLIYNHPFTVFVEWTLFLTVFWFAISKRKNLLISFLLFFLVLGFFVSKGNAPPLGQIFESLFVTLPFLQVFRNPFEKLGLISTLSFSLLFGFVFGSITIHNKFYKSLKTTFVLLILLGLFGFPFWTGLIYTGNEPITNNPDIGIRVTVPGYYKDLREWLTKEGSERYITFPISGEGIVYDWPKGYDGVELSSLLINGQGIASTLQVPLYFNVASDLERLFIKYSDFERVAKILNVRFLIHRNDVDFKLSNIRDPQVLKKVFEERSENDNSNLFKEKEFGPLSVYRFSDDLVLPKIYPATGVILSNETSELEDFWFTDKVGKESALINQAQFPKETYNNLPQKSEIYHTRAFFRLKGPTEFAYIDEITILPHVKHTAKSRVYPLVLLKEKVAGMLIFDKNKYAEFEIMLLGKRLLEAKISQEQGLKSETISSLENYRLKFSKTLNFAKTLESDPKTGFITWRSAFLKEVIGTHVSLLDQLSESALGDEDTLSEVIKTKNFVLESAISYGLIPKNRPITNDQFKLIDRQIYQFKVTSEKEFEFVFPEFTLDKHFIVPDMLTVQVDDRLEKRTFGKTTDGYITLGTFKFTQGIHEISFNLPQSINLVGKLQNPVMLETLHEIKEFEFPIANFDPNSKYKLFTNYYTRLGESPTIFVSQNVDPKISDDIFRIFSNKLPQNDYWFDFQPFSTEIGVSTWADTASFVFKVEPWNNCVELSKHYEERCEDELIKKTYDRKTQAIIKELEVSRAFLSDPVLRYRNKTYLASVDGNESAINLNFERISSTKYRVSVKNNSGTFLLVFSELYDKDWKAYINNPTESVKFNQIPSENHIIVNGYANGWVVENPGDLEIVIEFWPQKLLYIGLLVSSISITGGLAFIVRKLYLNLKR